MAKGNSVLAWHGFELFVLRRCGALSDQIESMGTHGQERFALEQSEQILVEAGMNLQRVAAVFHDVRINEARNDTALNEGFAEALG